MLGYQATNRRAQGIVGIGFGAVGLGFTIGRRCGLFFGCFTGHGTLLESANQLLTQHGGAGVFDDRFQNTGFGCRYFQYHFVGFDVDDHFVAFNPVTRLFVPGGDSGIGDGLG